MSEFTVFGLASIIPCLGLCLVVFIPLTFFFIIVVSWVVANVMTESWGFFRKCDRNSGHRCLYNSLAWNCGLIIIYLPRPAVRSWWSKWGIMAACYCYSWWGWWSCTLWVTLIGFLPHSSLCYLQSVVGEFLCNPIDVCICTIGYAIRAWILI
jgi:hypothetical protein